MSDQAVLQVKGRVLVGPEEIRDELWVVDGRITYDRPPGARDIRTVEGWALPGLVDAHCHVGLGPHGPVPEDTAEKQALTDRDAGTLLLRDAGSPSDTRWTDDREDLPKIIRAGRHIARTRRYIRGFAHEIEPDDLVAYVGREARRGDGWVKLVGDWLDRGTGDLSACWPREEVEAAIAEAHRLGARVTAHCFAEDSLRDLVEAGIDCVEHATGLTEDTIPLFAAARRRDRPDPGEHRDVPEPRGSRRRQVPDLVGPYAPTARAPLRHGALRVRRGDPGVRRHGRGGHVAARAGRGGGGRADEGRHPGGRGAVGDDVGRAGVAGPTRSDGGRGGGPGGVRERSAGGRTGVGGAARGWC